jgi:hypothetical protein
VVLDFGTQLAGQAVKLRFRFATDGGLGDGGWRVDNVAASGITGTPFPALLPEPTVCRKR